MRAQHWEGEGTEERHWGGRALNPAREVLQPISQRLWAGLPRLQDEHDNSLSGHPPGRECEGGGDGNIMDNRQESSSIFRKEPQAHFLPRERGWPAQFTAGILPWKMNGMGWPKRESRVGEVWGVGDPTRRE